MTLKCLNDISVHSSVHDCNTRNKKDLQIPFLGQVLAKEPFNFETCFCHELHRFLTK